MGESAIEEFKNALESRRSNLEKNLPACRVCGQQLEFIDEQEQRWYCYNDDQVWLGNEQKWLGGMPEAPKTQLELQQHVKYCKKCGNTLELEDEFCDKCGGAQKKVPVTASADGQKISHNKPSALWYLVPLVFGAIGGVVGHVGVKEDDKKMANDLLTIGIVITVLAVFIVLLLFVI